MKKLIYAITNELDEYDQICASKRQPTRNILQGLRVKVSPHYQNYLNRFASIIQYPPNNFNTSHSNNLKKCYQHPTFPLDDLKARLVNSQSDTFKLLCPYCLISNHSTFDHYVPIEEHPVFGVLSKNLIPCCDTCNKKKLSYWKENNGRGIIHFYNDSIPTFKFLYCDITFNGTIPILRYSLNFNNVSTNATARVRKHFRRLNLLNRYDEAVAGVISNVNIDVNSLENPSKPAIKRFLLRKSVNQQLTCGINYWQALAYEALANSAPFILNL